MSEHCSIFRITHDKLTANILPCQIRSQIELAGITWPANRLDCSENLDFITERDPVAPTGEELGVTGGRFAINLDRFRPQNKGCRVSGRKSRFAHYHSADGRGVNFLTQL